MVWGLFSVLVVLSLFAYSGRKNFWLSKPLPWWYILFFFSGFPALLYQIVWQRALFTIYGVNVESVTVVVTSFMLGLGLGSLLGGAISRKHTLPLLAVFGVVELSIAVWGLFSLRIFHWAASFTAGAPPLQTGLLSFALVVIPTLLMGSTLPLLVAHTVRLSGNVGSSVGALYAVNTLGSAAACFCAGLFLMRRLGESGSVSLAAALNAAVGLLVLLWYFRTRNRTANNAPRLQTAAALGRESSAVPTSTESSPGSLHAGSTPAIQMNFFLAMLVVGMAGFISLAYEILWYRLFSFTTGGLAKSFAFLLGAYLAGIGFGSLATEPLCRTLSPSRAHFRRVTAFIFAANLLGFLVAPILASIVRYASYSWTLLPIGLAAACLGAVFPLTCHISVAPDGCAGARMSYLYMSNILGSALGSYVVGFVLMDFFSLKHIAVAFALAGMGLSAALLFAAQLDRKRLFTALAAACVIAAFFLLSSSALFDSIYEKLVIKEKYQPGARFVHVVETKSGVVTVTRGGAVLGGGVYDGRYNVNLIQDTNGVQRAFAVSYFHPAPKDVLMIGLSSGSWAQIIANHPQVERLTIVEINPGYLQLIPQYGEVAGLLKNPKVQIVIDDGRRWLVRNPESKFDLVVSNTTFHWRSHTTSLLSADFLQLIRRHLNPGGVHFYNTTGSDEVQATGVTVFPYALRVANFLAVSDTPLQLDRERWRQILSRYAIDGKPVFDLRREDHRARLDEVLAMTGTLDLPSEQFDTLESAAHLRARTRNALIVTDDNMGTEWAQ